VLGLMMAVSSCFVGEAIGGVIGEVLDTCAQQAGRMFFELREQLRGIAQTDAVGAWEGHSLDGGFVIMSDPRDDAGYRLVVFLRDAVRTAPIPDTSPGTECTASGIFFWDPDGGLASIHAQVVNNLDGGDGTQLDITLENMRRPLADGGSVVFREEPHHMAYPLWASPPWVDGGASP